MTDPGVLAWPELQDWLAAEPALLPGGDPAVPVLFVAAQIAVPSLGRASRAIAATAVAAGPVLARRPARAVAPRRASGRRPDQAVGRALDFGAPDDLAALRRLLARADVVLEASRPRALRQLGLDAEEYVAGGTIWATHPAYGRTGEDAQRIGYGDDVAAAAGLVAYCGDIPYPGNPPPSAAAVDPAARTVSADPAEVIATGPETWAVRTASGLVPVAAPRARRARSVAAFLGRDTREVLADL